MLTSQVEEMLFFVTASTSIFRYSAVARISVIGMQFPVQFTGFLRQFGRDFLTLQQIFSFRRTDKRGATAPRTIRAS